MSGKKVVDVVQAYIDDVEECVLQPACQEIHSICNEGLIILPYYCIHCVTESFP